MPGGGYSRWNDLALTRWREDSAPWRQPGARMVSCHIRDITSTQVWSAAYQPTLRQADHYEAIFSEGRAEFWGRSNEYEMHTEIAVSPEDDIELRRVRITNHARKRREIDVTSYAEVVLSTADRGLPASGVQQPFCTDRNSRKAFHGTP